MIDRSVKTRQELEAQEKTSKKPHHVPMIAAFSRKDQRITEAVLGRRPRQSDYEADAPEVLKLAVRLAQVKVVQGRCVSDWADGKDMGTQCMVCSY